jgi:hypothetical protein
LKLTIALFVVTTAVTSLACRSGSHDHIPRQPHAEVPGAVRRVIAFKHQDAASAANHARADFGMPPMEAIVRVECDTRSNSWVVFATPADMVRIEAIALRFDQPVLARTK